ncbi:hypothetical protein AURDEDRAFT_160053 [Auricularia subglabra TFB-10046 SS5]|nr:hypothetical protein AURDEDRAFT_160053 [Auricularia subglabra TFB-10046 SS5]
MPFIARAPEAAFAAREGRPLGRAADIWALAGAIFAVHARSMTLSEFLSSGSTAEAMREAISALGSPLPAWAAIWTADGNEVPVPEGSVPLLKRVEEPEALTVPPPAACKA